MRHEKKKNGTNKTQSIETDQQMTQLLKLVKALNNFYKYIKLFLGKDGYNEGISGKKLKLSKEPTKSSRIKNI